jgi:hypothetical protein
LPQRLNRDSTIGRKGLDIGLDIHRGRHRVPG